MCTGDGEAGCGLALCSTCAVKLVTEHEGKLDALIQEMKAQDDGLGVRADVEMIHPAGELLRRMSGMGDAGDNGVGNRQGSVGGAEHCNTQGDLIRNRQASVGWGEGMDDVAAQMGIAQETQAGDAGAGVGSWGFH